MRAVQLLARHNPSLSVKFHHSIEVVAVFAWKNRLASDRMDEATRGIKELKVDYRVSFVSYKSGKLVYCKDEGL